MEWCNSFLFMRLTPTEEVTTRARIAFVPHTPIALADSIEMFDVVVPSLNLVDIDCSVTIFFKNLENDEGSSVEKDIVGTLQHRKIKMRSGTQSEHLEPYQKTPNTFSESTELAFFKFFQPSKRKRRCITLLAGGAAAAPVLRA